ncbi:MAG: hypothetical protein Tsb009_01790 [Planctomycetaceae bacterium]
MRSKDFQIRLFHEGRDDIVTDLGMQRAWKIQDCLPEAVNDFPDLKNGKLLLFFPDATLSDGAAEMESEGFYDVSNTPPWDTWISYFEDRTPIHGSYDTYLLAFVPAELVELAEIGITINPEECIQWLTDADVKLRDRLSPHLTLD